MLVRKDLDDADLLLVRMFSMTSNFKTTMQATWFG